MPTTEKERRIINKIVDILSGIFICVLIIVSLCFDISVFDTMYVPGVWASIFGAVVLSGGALAIQLLVAILAIVGLDEGEK